MTYAQSPLACDECAEDVTEATQAPSCGAHLLHIDCAPWFSCRDCDYIRAEVPC